VWQALHAELDPAGLTVVTVALDTDIEAARPFHEGSEPTHPSLVDPSLSLVDMFGFTNVPFGIWVDESGTIVRPAEVAYAPRPPQPSGYQAQGYAAQQRVIQELPPERQQVIEAMRRQTRDTERYGAAVRDWVANGAASRYVLSPDEVTGRSRPRPQEAARAAAEFELGQHLHRAGHKLDAVNHFKEAHRLDPTNWSYFRNAVAIVDHEDMGDVYGTDLLTEVARVGPETFYPELTI
jgi:hypothetical protein